MEGNVKAQIQKYLVESGNYEKISNLLTERLLQDGWIDKIRTLTMEEITKNEKAGYIEILNKIEPQAMELVMKQIRDFLDDIVDTK
ncbi:hypothetical protein RI543_001865 [Arxiozyma heterogenica]|uniref:Transcription and mRNA export factor SUS1 n=1 Tax=Arxiozyma heterogenica TaxID=278026 RepID=A0AAN7WHY4_9SACH|nr:hypothetical protein RI543_001865 [Kazachstania heterogenica]